MRVLFLASDRRRVGGIQLYNRHLVEALRKNAAVSLIEFRESIFSKVFFSLKFFLWAAVLRTNLVVASHINFGILAYWWQRISGCPYVIVSYGIDALSMTVAQKRYMRSAIRIVTISRYTKEKLLSQVPELEGKIYLLPNAIEDSRFSPAARSEELVKILHLSGKRVILTIARLSATERYKGYDTVIRALPPILKQVPDAVYVLAGDGDDLPRIRDLVRSMNFGDAVRLPGYVKDGDLSRYYNLADVFVMPSTGEGFGFVFLEALACGKPVIAGNRDGSRDALLDGKAGILVDPLDVAGLAHAIVDVLMRRADERFFDPRYLRRTILEAYGIPQFNKRVGSLIDLLRSTS